MACGGNVEQATNLLLEGKFPKSLKGLDPQLSRASGELQISQC